MSAPIISSSGEIPPAAPRSTPSRATSSCCASARSSERRGRAPPWGRAAVSPLVAPVRVLEADDIVFAEIAAGLHLDEVERDLAGILEAMRRAQRDVGRLVLVEKNFLVAAHHLGS